MSATTKFDKRANELEIEKLQAQIQLHDSIRRVGLREVLLALVEEYSLANVKEFLRKISDEGER